MAWSFGNQSVLNAIAALSAKVTTGFANVTQQLGKIMATQTDIDNAVTVLNGLLQDVSGQDATILTDLQLIQQQVANGQPVDTSKLNAAVATVQGIQTGLDSAVAALTTEANPTPPATPTA